MSADEEEFIHYVECIYSLNRAWSILQDLGGVEQPSALHSAAFRFALIEYAKPYTRSDGIHARRKLQPPQLPTELLALHEQLLDLRNKVLAHSDLTLKQAKLHVSLIGGQPSYVISSNIAETLPNREAVINLIERTLDQMYVESARRTALLSPTD
jgi:hypothetical protein